jgi:hypothetical protein
MTEYELAPLRRFDPKKVVPEAGNDPLATFLLALAVVYDDLKGLYLLRSSHLKSKPPDKEISANAGQWRGMDIQLERYVIALVHELMVLMEVFAIQANGHDVSAWMTKAPASVRTKWQNLVRIATGAKAKGGDAIFSKTLLQIRNSIASHYYQPKTLVAGYRKHFFTAQKSASNEAAYASLGKNMEETRFYYADAALQAAITNLSGNIGEKEFARRVRKVVDDINESLEYVLRRHLELHEIK